MDVSLTTEAFEGIFINYYEPLYGYAYGILKNELFAEEVASDVFYRLWLKKETIKIDTSLAGYLFRSVYNGCMDKVRENKKKQAFWGELQHQSAVLAHHGDAAGNINTKDLENNLRDALSVLPEQCRTVFQLNRMEGLSYRDIANRLGISIKTVEAHMGKALRRLRVSLAEFLTLLIFLLWH